MKHGFQSDLIVKDLDGNRWELITPLEYLAANGERYVVPAGFLSDFASVPRFAWIAIPKSGRYNEAAVLHDYLYRTQPVSRGEADRLFREAMETLDVRMTQRWVMWGAVRIGGWRIWRRRRADLG